MTTIALIACVKSKLGMAAESLRLYRSPLFRWSVAYADLHGADHLYVLSAKHGLVPGDRVLEPYEETLIGASREHRARWSDAVIAELARRHDLVRDRFLLLAGEHYLSGLRSALRKRNEPLHGLPMVRRLARLRSATKTATERACELLHRRVRSLPRVRMPFDPARLPRRGIYFVFERGERAHGGERIVRIGTHTGVKSTLGGRLAEHYAGESKDRSIFRKNLGRALLARSEDPYLAIWDLDLTTAAAKSAAKRRVRPRKQAAIERKVSAYLCERTSFAVLDHPAESGRLRWLESGLIATVAQCRHCWASDEWLGHHSPVDRVRDSSLWQSLQLRDRPMRTVEVERVFRSSAVKASARPR